MVTQDDCKFLMTFLDNDIMYHDTVNPEFLKMKKRGAPIYTRSNRRVTHPSSQEMLNKYDFILYFVNIFKIYISKNTKFLFRPVNIFLEPHVDPFCEV